MLFWLRSEDGASAKYLIGNEIFRVGRKEGEIVIADDLSISRKHAVFTVTGDGISLEDSNSKYNTYVDDVKLQPFINTPLTVGCKIKFGSLQSVFTLECVKLVVATSTLKKAEKAALINNVLALKGTVLDTWKPNCTTLVVKEITLTPKVLTCIICGTPIVTPKYFTDFLRNIEKGQIPPDLKNYTPPCGEAVLPQKSISLDYDPTRKTLFGNKIFVFSNKIVWSQMIDLIQAAGGKVVLFDGENITVNIIDNSKEEYVFLNDSESFGTKKELQPILNYLKHKNQRTIPLQEIAMAIVSNSCSKDCNPNFDRVANLVENVDKTFTCDEALVLNTETQRFENVMKVEEGTVIVPASYENPITSNLIVEESIKRNGEEIIRNDIQNKITKINVGSDVHQKSPTKLTQSNITTFIAINKPTSPSSEAGTSKDTKYSKRKLQTALNESYKTDEVIELSDDEDHIFKRPKIEESNRKKSTEVVNKKSENNLKNTGNLFDRKTQNIFKQNKPKETDGESNEIKNCYEALKSKCTGTSLTISVVPQKSEKSSGIKIPRFDRPNIFKVRKPENTDETKNIHKTTNEQCRDSVATMPRSLISQMPNNKQPNIFKQRRTEEIKPNKTNESSNKRTDGMDKFLSSTVLSQDDSTSSFFSLDMSTIKHEKLPDSGGRSITVGTNKNGRSNGVSNIKKEELDPEVEKFIESFRNTCNVVVKNCLAPEKSRIIVNASSTSSNSSFDIKNFKKFRKNPLIRHQTTIIPRSQFQSIPARL